MAKRCFTATEKATGRTWLFFRRRTFGHNEYQHILFNGGWSPTLKAAKEAAKQANRFRYDDEPALITTEA